MYRLSSLILVLFGFTQIFAQSSPHGDALKIDCTKCHTSAASWKIDKKTITFDHNETSFALVGSHADTDCVGCHKSLIFNEAKNDCMSCHTDMHSASVGNDCARCHTPKSWTVDNIPQLHEENGFPLTGSHSGIDCLNCHKSETNLRFDRIGNECITCHKSTFQNAKNPDHVAGNYSTNCIDCHSSFLKEWTPSTFEHSFFPLTDGHNISDCKQCHTSNNFSDANSDCISCHQGTFDKTQNPNHINAGFDTDCKTCHTTSPGWTPVTWDHNFFPLTKGHDIQDCNACHTITTNYADTPVDCVGCHQNTFNETTNPNHVTSGFPTDCASCHTTDPGWTPSTFNHDFFPLTQGHDLPDCKQCHTTANFSDATADCVSCHQTTFDNTASPNHTAAGLSTDCISCHNTSGWSPSIFDHGSFPLTLGHDLGNTLDDCKKCHVSDNFSDATTDCVSCHQTTFNNTTDPNHVSGGFPTDCASCHNTNPGWTPATFDHTNFPLTLGHDLPDCTQCHTNNNFTNTSTDCVSCHQTTFNNTTNPDHIAANFPTDCTQCHTTNPGWTPATFDHTNFPLTLGHDITDCTQCHINGNYTNTSSDCVSCHQTTFDNTTNPDHKAAGFPTDCAACHTTNPGWTPATFDHTNFPLTLGHNITDCTQCHINGNYTNTSSDCVSCHQTTYDNTTNPDHAATGFSTDCIQCHTTNPGWTPSTFDHTQYFPIASGKHSGFNCNECHTTANTLSTFSCIACHEHSNQSSLAGDHNGVSGYTYVSTECYSCHPSGNKDGNEGGD